MKITKPTIRRRIWTVSIWMQDSDDDPPTWAGLLQTRTGQEWPFHSLAELNRLLYELGGWIDPRGDGEQ